jgi:hypothetical protein
VLVQNNHILDSKFNNAGHPSRIVLFWGNNSTKYAETAKNWESSMLRKALGHEFSFKLRLPSLNSMKAQKHINCLACETSVLPILQRATPNQV